MNIKEPKLEIVAYEVFNFRGSNIYCPNCLNNHPDSKDWIKKSYNKKDLIKKEGVSCSKCERGIDLNECH
jgi:hypothetical protein